MTVRHFLSIVCTIVLTLAAQDIAHAYEAPFIEYDRVNVESPEWFNLEFRGGPYVPGVGNSSAKDIFGSDKGLLWAIEVDLLFLRIPYVGQLGAGLGFGWSGYKAKALKASGTGSTPEMTTDSSGNSTFARSGESTDLTLLPLTSQAILLVDGLSRELQIPLIFIGKLGMDSVFWNTNTGVRDDADGIALGLRWGLQVGLELDFLDRDSARMLDEEYGMNHTRLFFELYGSKAGSQKHSLPVGDTTFALGLAFTL